MRAMPAYLVECGAPGCGAPAAFKIASEWSDGPTRELKTYFLCCAECLKPLHQRAGEKQRDCRLAPREALAPPGVYELARGSADHGLVRRPTWSDSIGGNLASGTA